MPGKPLPRHPAWAKARHLALPMLLCWFIMPFAFHGVPAYGRSLPLGFTLVVLGTAMLFVYIRAAALNYRHTQKVLNRGQCLDCGYELWPTIEAGRWECPECGRDISMKMAEQVMRLQSFSKAADSD